MEALSEQRMIKLTSWLVKVCLTDTHTGSNSHSAVVQVLYLNKGQVVVLSCRGRCASEHRYCTVRAGFLSGLDTFTSHGGLVVLGVGGGGERAPVHCG